MKRMIILGIVASPFLAVSTTSVAMDSISRVPNGSGSLAGIVLKESTEGSVPVPDASVILASARTGRHVIKTWTDRNGKFIFKSLKEGEYFLTTFREDVGGRVDFVEIVDGKVTEVKIILARPNSS